MATRIVRPTRRETPAQISTAELRTAKADLGPTWPARFGDHEITEASEALARELKAGTLLDAISLTPRGKLVLREARRPMRDGRFPGRRRVAAPFDPSRREPSRPRPPPRPGRLLAPGPGRRTRPRTTAT